MTSDSKAIQFVKDFETYLRETCAEGHSKFYSSLDNQTRKSAAQINKKISIITRYVLSKLPCSF